jgi:hypothetical protein
MKNSSISRIRYKYQLRGKRHAAYMVMMENTGINTFIFRVYKFENKIRFNSFYVCFKDSKIERFIINMKTNVFLKICISYRFLCSLLHI